VTERTTELQRLNEDLLQFAHVVSHDLKEPIRKIRTFNDRLVQEFDHLWPDRAKRFLEKIEQSSSRMLSLIDGILSYSSQNINEQSFEIFDLNESILEEDCSIFKD